MLPVQLTAFIGRSHELAELERLSARARLLTLTGAGGSGKTRLALEVAARAARSGGREVGWVELAGISDAALVPQRVAEALGVREEGPRDVAKALVERCREQALLLVLDNCEHVVAAAAELVEVLLRGCPQLHVLATSREPLGIGGERAWLIPPLAHPAGPAAELSPDDAAGFDAVRLFVERAQDVAPAFALDAGNAAAVVEICRRLDGIPLAIELAAARVRVLSPPQILARLEDAFRLLNSGSRSAIPRHRTLRATIDWSYELLTADEQQLLDRLSVFHGGFTLEAAEAVCADAPAEAAAMLDVLARLVDRSLVVMREHGGSARYRLLETVRQYAAERLRGRGEEAVLRARHAAHVGALVAAAEPHLITAARPPWLARLHDDLDNLRAALAWTREADPAAHLRLTGGLCWFWFSSGLWSEGRRWAEEALALAPAGAAARAPTLFAAAVIAALQAQPQPAAAWLDEALALARAGGDARLVAYAQNYLGMALVQQGKPEGEAPVQEALAWFRAAGDLYGLRLSLLLLATLRIGRGDLARATDELDEALVVARRFGLPRELGIALHMRGYVALLAGDLERAARWLHESLAALQQDPQYLFLARGLELVGILAGRRGHAADGVRLLGAGAALREQIGAAMFQSDRAALTGHLDELRAAVGDGEAWRGPWDAGRRLRLADALALAAAHATAPIAPAAPVVPAPAAAHDPDAAVRVLALGAFEVHGGAAHGDAWSSARVRELLVYLLCHPRGRTRAQVGLDFWPDASTAQVKNSFHVLLHRLRKGLGRADLIVVDDDRYRVDTTAVWFDAAAFEQAVTAAGADAARLEHALALYRGDLLDGDAAGDWLSAHQARLRDRRHHALATLAAQRLQAGDATAAAAALTTLLAADPLREDAHRNLMLAHARNGQRERALDQYGTLLALLDDELDAAPERATVELAARIRRAEPV